MKEYRFFMIMNKYNQVIEMFMFPCKPKTQNKKYTVLEITLNTYMELKGF